MTSNARLRGVIASRIGGRASPRALTGRLLAPPGGRLGRALMRVLGGCGAFETVKLRPLAVTARSRGRAAAQGHACPPPRARAHAATGKGAARRAHQQQRQRRRRVRGAPHPGAAMRAAHGWGRGALPTCAAGAHVQRQIAQRGPWSRVSTARRELLAVIANATGFSPEAAPQRAHTYA